MEVVILFPFSLISNECEFDYSSKAKKSYYAWLSTERTNTIQAQESGRLGDFKSLFLQDLDTETTSRWIVGRVYCFNALGQKREGLAQKK